MQTGAQRKKGPPHITQQVLGPQGPKDPGHEGDLDRALPRRTTGEAAGPKPEVGPCLDGALVPVWAGRGQSWQCVLRDGREPPGGEAQESHSRWKGQQASRP